MRVDAKLHRLGSSQLFTPDATRHFGRLVGKNHRGLTRQSRREVEPQVTRTFHSCPHPLHRYFVSVASGSLPVAAIFFRFLN
jgi:hypothetical protein